ncbi:hypothetical protein BDY21DRAFT_341658 [Lineolata rhizophorae]|uniref:Uncharacterized protein n=1 Tax=Lineolata rhizophorae TaxID=578093 RepID=A0A6A6P2Y0_9PEZI|nr:hypothetical protein BDY21DRAFT_341658 [Lineolata rhizophorae]
MAHAYGAPSYISTQGRRQDQQLFVADCGILRHPASLFCGACPSIIGECVWGAARGPHAGVIASTIRV